MGRIPLQEITRMVLLADTERISAQTALRISLVTEVTTAQALWTRAHELAAMIAQRHPVAVQGSHPRDLGGAEPAARAGASPTRCATSKSASRWPPTRRPTDLKSKGWTLR